MRSLYISMLFVSATLSTPSVHAADVGSIVQNVQGVESDVKGSISDVNKRVLDIFKQEGIQSTGVESLEADKKQILKGKKDNMEVQVNLTPGASGQTHVAITAKSGPLSWNKDFAQNILSKVVQQSS